MRGKLLEFVFQQDITREILAVNHAVTYDSYNTRLDQFVSYPRSYDKRYILPGDVLIYCRSDVRNCPRVRELVGQFAPNDVGWGEEMDEDSEGDDEDSDDDYPRPLPSLIAHAASASRRGSSTEVGSPAVTPRRSLRHQQRSASRASTCVTPRRAVSATSSALSTPGGGKRKRILASGSSARKCPRISGTVISHMVLGRDGEVWEMVDKEIAIRMTG